MMTTRNVTVLLGAFVLTVIGLLWMLTGGFDSQPGINPELPANVSIRYGKPENPSGTPRSTPRPTPPPLAAAVSPTPSVSQPERLLHVVDALGEPVPAGRVSFGTAFHAFRNGKCPIPAALYAGTTLRVQAEGYFPAEEELPSNPSLHPTVVMEYESTYSIQVLDEKSEPVPNATVRLWKTCDSQRPVARAFTIESKVVAQQQLLPVAVTARGLEVQEPPAHSRIVRTSGSERHAFPETGSVLVNYFHASWYPTTRRLWEDEFFIDYREPQGAFHSQRLRMLDSLGFSSADEGVNRWMYPYEFTWNGERKIWYMSLPMRFHHDELHTSATTDAAGQALLNHIPPGLYYADAITDTRSSLAVPLFPAVGGVVLKMRQGYSLLATIRRGGMDYQKDSLRTIRQATITATHVQTGEIFTDHMDGQIAVGLHPIPKGSYTVVAEFLLDGIEHRMEQPVLVDRWNTTVLFTVNNWQRNSFSGVVLDADTNEPVSGVPLYLRSHDQREPWNRLPADTSADASYRFSDAQGRFHFAGLPNGKYLIHIVENDDWSAVSYGKQAPPESAGLDGFLQPVRENTTSSADPNSILLENADITSYPVVVQQHRETTLSGHVLSTQGSPIESALVEVFYLFPQHPNPDRADTAIREIRVRTLPRVALTDEQGRFELSVPVSQVSDMPIKLLLRARQGTYADTLIRIHEEGWMSSSDDSDFVTLGQGDTFIEVAPGGSKHGIEIVVNTDASRSAIVRLFAGEPDPGEFSVSVNQDGRMPPVQKISPGIYHISELMSIPFSLKVRSEDVRQVESPNGPRQVRRYLSEYLDLEFPAHESQMFIDITLRKEAYLVGRVISRGERRLEALSILFQPLEGPHALGATGTTLSANGKFFWSVQENVPHRILIADGDWTGENIQHSLHNQSVMPGETYLEIELPD